MQIAQEVTFDDVNRVMTGRNLKAVRASGKRNPDIAGVVASTTESEKGVLSEKLQTTPLVNRDSSTRWAGCLDVQSE